MIKASIAICCSELRFSSNNGNEYAETGSVLIDNSTGAILGFIGGRNFATNQNNHAFDTQRSPASTIKPLLVYGIAITDDC